MASPTLHYRDAPICLRKDDATRLAVLRKVASSGKKIGEGSYGGQVIEVCVQGARQGTIRAAAREICAPEKSLVAADFATFKRRLLTECEIIGQINHPNVVQLLGIHYPTSDAKLPWLVMEMMECSLTTFLGKCEKVKLSLHSELSILVDISQGLEFLHGKNIIHGDLSSNNVFLTKRSVAKIGDLRVANIVEVRRYARPARNMCFMPPEVLEVPLDKDGFPVDVFSLGCVACHVMSHKVPVPKNHKTEVLRRVEYLQSFGHSLLKELVASCLQDNPLKRPRVSFVCSRLKEFKQNMNKRFILFQVTSGDKEIYKGLYGQVIEVCVHGTLFATKQIRLIEEITLIEFEAFKFSFLAKCFNASQIHHPNVVQVLGIHYPTPEAKLPWLVMEMMELSLTTFLEQNEKVPFHTKLSILVDVSQALEFLHGQDIIHGDLSSSKVLLTQQFVAKITIVGVAKLIKHKIKGQAQNSSKLHFFPVDHESTNFGKPVDIFSLGCVACHVMSQQWPEPKNLCDEKAPTEVQRRADYLRACAQLPLKKLIESCLFNKTDQPPKISDVCATLKNIRASMCIANTKLLDALYQICLSGVTGGDGIIGVGSFGLVLEVWIHGIKCAARYLFVENISISEQEATRTSFLTECVNTSRLNHPNVVQVLGIHYPSPEAKLPWLVMERMEYSLTDLLKKYNKGKVPLSFKLSILVEICQGLEFLHGQNIIHRNLSSNNILLTKHFVAKISDVGMANLFGNKEARKHPKRILFMAPEVLSENPQYGKPADIFSLACVALHVMSHLWPKPLSDIQGSEIVRRDKYLKLCMQEVSELLKSCLDVQPDQRPIISEVHTRLSTVASDVENNTPLSTANSIELHASLHRKIYLPEIDPTDCVTVIGMGIYSKVLKVNIHGLQCAAKEINLTFDERFHFKDFKASFLTNCVSISQVHHPNVVQVLGIHYPDKSVKLPWIVMEMMDTNLTSFLEKYEKDQVEPYKLPILINIAQGLEFLHCKDIVHGHLSSAKILLTSQLVAKIADLGVTKVLRKYCSTVPQNSDFMSPESVITPSYKKPVDMFSLGCIACHVMSHRWPIPKKVNRGNTLTEMQKREEYLKSFVDGTSFRRAVEGCLADKPEGRPNIIVTRMCFEGFKEKYYDNFAKVYSTTDRFLLIKQQCNMQKTIEVSGKYCIYLLYC